MMFISEYDVTGLQVENESIKEWNNRLRDISKLADLDENWDGEGAKALDDDLLSSAADYVKLLYKKNRPVPTRIVASQDGEIIIEWQVNGYYIEVEISEPFKAEWMCEDEDGHIKTWAEEWTNHKEVPTYLMENYRAA